MGAALGRRLALGVAALGTLAAARAADYPQPPQALFKDLFVAVQTQAIYPDGKTFVDMVPDAAPEVILGEYHAAHPDSAAVLKRFTDAHFTLPAGPAAPSGAAAPATLVAHIDGLWSQLTRETTTAPQWSSRQPQPKTNEVPGGPVSVI